MDDVDFLLAGRRTADAHLVDMDAVERKRLLGSLIRVTKGFDFILLDLAAGSDSLPLAIRSDEVLLVSTGDSCADTKALTRRLVTLGCPTPRLIVNRAGSRVEAEDVYTRVCRALAHGDAAPVYWGYIPEDAAVPQAERWQKPFLVTAPDAPSSRHVRGLAWRVLGGQTPGGGVHASLPRFRHGHGGKDRGRAA
jgi:MinD-like ATPase involved in chromosome partitioning or flagellar assembly